MKPIKVSIAGLGVVGSGVIGLLQEDRRFTRQGLKFEIVGVSARNRQRQRAVEIDPYRWFDDPVEMASDPETDIFVELMGGSDGPAKVAVMAALEAGKPVVTANKALIAEHGAELAALAEKNNAPLCFEAAVAGGTPVVSGIRVGIGACTVNRVSGILNGTCNYILSTMASTGASFEDVLLEAQKAGFAEADPSFDVDGIDAAHKLAILASLAFDAAIPMSMIETHGIRKISQNDISAAQGLGMAIKLLAQAFRENDTVGLRVTPALIPFEHSFAQAQGSQNAVVVEADPVGRIGFSGPGAGAGATASAVAADLCQVARGAVGPVFASPVGSLQSLGMIPADRLQTPYFIRLSLSDTPGAMAKVAQALADQAISIESMTQPPSHHDAASVVIVTHHTSMRAVGAAMQSVAGQPFLLEEPTFLPIITP